MSRLYDFDERQHEKLSRSKLRSVEACILYYLYNRRNAWHSTWSTRYTAGCMHTSLDSAKATAERQRTQGSVFYISEIPALLFRSAQGALAVTQINDTLPLKEYSPDATTGEVALGVKKIRGALDCYLVPGAPMLGVALSFDASSRFWRQRPNAVNSVKIVASSAPGEDFLPVPRRRRRWRSASYGGVYALSWYESSNGKPNSDPKFVRALAREFCRRSSASENSAAVIHSAEPLIDVVGD